MKLPPRVQDFFKKAGARGAKKRTKNLTAERRKAIAKLAALARWAKKKGKGKK